MSIYRLSPGIYFIVMCSGVTSGFRALGQNIQDRHAEGIDGEECPLPR